MNEHTRREVFERLDKLNREDNVAALAALKKNGMEVFTLPADEQQRCQEHRCEHNRWQQRPGLLGRCSLCAGQIEL